MSVRRRRWTGRDGVERDAWIVDYRANGKRHIRTFKLKKHAEAFESQTNVDLRLGLHVAESASCTVAQAAAHWLQACRERGLEKWTLSQYDAHVRCHISPLIGGLRLSRLSVPAIRAFETELRA